MTRHTGEHSQQQPPPQQPKPPRPWVTSGPVGVLLVTTLLSLIGWLVKARVDDLVQRDAALAVEQKVLGEQQATFSEHQATLERNFAASEAASAERTRLLLAGMERIEKKLDRHMERR